MLFAKLTPTPHDLQFPNASQTKNVDQPAHHRQGQIHQEQMPTGRHIEARVTQINQCQSARGHNGYSRRVCEDPAEIVEPSE